MTTPTRTTMTTTETTTSEDEEDEDDEDATTKLMHAFYGLYPVLAFKKFQRVLRISFKDVEKYKEVLFLFLFCSFAIFFLIISRVFTKRISKKHLCCSFF